jgi:hypothetical protein
LRGAKVEVISTPATLFQEKFSAFFIPKAHSLQKRGAKINLPFFLKQIFFILFITSPHKTQDINNLMRKLNFHHPIIGVFYPT